jgi:hypothetical protein
VVGGIVVGGGGVIGVFRYVPAIADTLGRDRVGDVETDHAAAAVTNRSRPAQIDQGVQLRPFTTAKLTPETSLWLSASSEEKSGSGRTGIGAIWYGLRLGNPPRT